MVRQVLETGNFITMALPLHYIYTMILVHKDRAMQVVVMYLQDRKLKQYGVEKEELPRAGLEPTIFCVLGRCCTS